MAPVRELMDAVCTPPGCTNAPHSQTAALDTQLVCASGSSDNSAGVGAGCLGGLGVGSPQGQLQQLRAVGLQDVLAALSQMQPAAQDQAGGLPG